MAYSDALKQRIALATLGDYGYQRACSPGRPNSASALTYALEYQHSDGPWDVPSNFVKWNGLLRYAQPLARPPGADGDGLQRQLELNRPCAALIDSGLIGRFGTLDASDGGISSRYSLSADFSAPLAGGEFQTTAYWFRYRLNLYSNFSFFLNGPVNGDQFEQADDRNVVGWTGEWTKRATLWGRPTLNTLGYELRQDRIKPVGLYATRQRERLSTTRLDDVIESSAGVFASNDTQWTEGLRSIVGLRYDRYRFDVTSLSAPQNSGDVTAGIWSPKLSLVFGPWAQTEYFVNAGWGFHSNDARGVTIQVDPATGDPADPPHRWCAARVASWGCAP